MIIMRSMEWLQNDYNEKFMHSISEEKKNQYPKKCVYIGPRHIIKPK